MKKRKLTIVIWILSMVVALGAGVFALTEDCVHDWGEWSIVTESTCAVEGLKTRKCARCRVTEEAPLEKLDHTPGTTTVTKQATCLEDGVKTTRCKVCNQVAKTEPIKAVGYHTFVEDYTKRVNATCTVNGSKTYECTECGTLTLWQMSCRKFAADISGICPTSGKTIMWRAFPWAVTAR